MLPIGPALGLLLATIATGCSSVTPNRNPVGEPFPTVRGTSLAGADWTLPGDLAGAPALLLIGYVQNAQFDLDRWMVGIDQLGIEVRYYEIPTIDGLVPGLFAGSIDGGMRRGIPEELWGGVITVYGDADRIVALTGDENPNNGRIALLDGDGRIVWFHDRGFSPLHLRQLADAVRALTPPATEPASTDPASTGPASTDAASTWPQWRGPSRDGHSAGAPWPTSLDDDVLREQWRVELGPGYGGPIVTKDRVFTVETEDKRDEVVRAFDRATGRRLWETRWPGAMKVPFFAARNGSWIRSTPAWDGEHLFVAGMRDVLACLDGSTGDVVWRVDLADRYEATRPAFGCVSSPLVDGDHVYLQAAGGVVKLDKRSGESVWRGLVDGGGMQGSAFSSPLLTTLAGRRQLVVQSRKELVGLDPESGARLWGTPIKAFRGMNILTPTVDDGRLFTSAHSGRAQAFSIVPDEAGTGLTPQRQWDNKLQAYMSTPIVIDGHAYLHLRNRRFACVELATGAIRWITSKPFGHYWSLVGRDGRILALDQDGTLRLIDASPERFTLLAERVVAERDTWAHLAVAGDQLFVRAIDGLVAYRLGAPATR